MKFYIKKRTTLNRKNKGMFLTKKITLLLYIAFAILSMKEHGIDNYLQLTIELIMYFAFGILLNLLLEELHNW